MIRLLTFYVSLPARLWLLRCAILGGVLLAAGGGVGAAVVDTFDDPQAIVVAVQSDAQSGAMLGGARILALTTGEAGVSGGVLGLKHAQDATGTLEVVWCGPTLSSTGLGQLDLTADGGNAFLVGVLSAKQASTLVLTVATDSGAVSSASLPVPASLHPAYFRIAFAAFVGAADFTKVGAITLALTPGSAENDVRVDFVRTTTTAQVEPVARLTDVVLVDHDGDGRASAGDTLQYLLTLRNTGATTLQGVRVNVATPANTTLVLDSLTAAPLARSLGPVPNSAPGDDWHAAFDTSYARSTASGLTALSFAGIPAALVSSFGGNSLGGTVADHAAGTLASVDGHQLQINADGSLSYLPKPGFTGLFTFQYKIKNAVGESAATASIAVGERPVAMPDSLAAIGNVEIVPGAAQGVITSNHGSGVDRGSVAKVLTAGPDASRVNDAVVGVPTLTARGGNLTVMADGSFTYNPPAGITGDDSFYYQLGNGFEQTSVAKVTLAVSNRVWFVNAASATNGDGRFGTPFNSIAGFAASPAYASALPGDLVYLYSGGTYTGGYTLKPGQRLLGQSVNLESVLGFPVYSRRPVVGVSPQWTNAAISLPGVGATGEIRGLILSGSAGALVRGVGAGTTVLRDLALTASGAANGIDLSSGVANTFVEAHGVSITSTGTGCALRVVNTAIAAAGLNFTSISSSGPASTAILLSGTGAAGKLVITGSGVAASGGIISGTTGAAAISLSTAKASLAWLRIEGAVGTGILADAVTDLALSNCSVLSCATGALMDGNAAGLRATNLQGTWTITQSDFKDSSEDQIKVVSTAGNFTLNVTGGTIGRAAPQANGGGGLVLAADGSAQATVTVSGTTFSNNYGSGLLSSCSSSSDQIINVADCAFTGNNVGIDLAHSGGAKSSYKVERNNLTGQLAAAMRIGTAYWTATTSTTLHGVVRDNTIGNSSTIRSGSLEGAGIVVDVSGDAAGFVNVSGNTIQQTALEGFHAMSRLAVTTSASASLDLTYRGNTVAAPVNLAVGPYDDLYGTIVEVRDTRTLNLDIGSEALPGGNVSGRSGIAAADFWLRLRSTTAAFGLAGVTELGIAKADVLNHVQKANAYPGVMASASIEVGGTFTKVPSVQLPSND